MITKGTQTFRFSIKFSRYIVHHFYIIFDLNVHLCLSYIHDTLSYTQQ